MSDKYIYPEIIKFERNQILVNFPDCLTYENNIEEAYTYILTRS